MTIPAIPQYFGTIKYGMRPAETADIELHEADSSVIAYAKITTNAIQFPLPSKYLGQAKQPLTFEQMVNLDYS